MCAKMEDRHTGVLHGEKSRTDTTETKHNPEQDSPADKPARLKRMQKLLQFDVFRFISQNSISTNFKLPMHSFTRYVQALGLYCYTQFEIRFLPKFLV